MEYVEGPDLGKLMSAAKAKATRIPPWVAAYIIAEAARVCTTRTSAKRAGRPLDIVHRDVSPQNVLLSYEGAVKIADFGIATANLFREEAGVLKGKFGYMSPEQARGEKVDRRSDIYALGVILHELLTARPLHGRPLGRQPARRGARGRGRASLDVRARCPARARDYRHARAGARAAKIAFRPRATCRPRSRARCSRSKSSSTLLRSRQRITQLMGREDVEQSFAAAVGGR